MKKLLFVLALFTTPAYAGTKQCGLNNQLPDDLTPAELSILKTAKEDLVREEQLRIANNKARDASVSPEMLAYFHERDREREAMRVKEDVPGASTICSGRLGHTYYHQHYVPTYIPRYVPRYIPRYRY